MKILFDKIMEFVFLFSLFLSISLLFGYSLTSFADDYYKAKVGRYDNNGAIQLEMDVFSTTFPDGGPIDEIGLMELGGFIYIVRKGFDSEGNCRSERVELVAENLVPLTAEANLVEDSPVFIFSGSTSYRQLCRNKGCSGLNNIIIPGQNTESTAMCDISEDSEYKCACHLNVKNSITIIQNDNLCLNEVRPVTPVVVESWVPACLDDRKINSGLTRVKIIPC